MSYTVRYTTLPAKEIFGMVGRCGGGYNTIWEDWTPEGRRARNCIMQEFEQGLDKICGHYRRLEESIKKEGMRNPIIVTCGRPVRRTMNHLPPELRRLRPNKLLLLESTQGGSRLWLAQKHNLKIKCIVNDWTGRFDHCPQIATPADALQYYADPPKSISFHPKWGFTESFDQTKVSYHLGDEWSEDRIMPLRAPLWVSIMNKYGYRVDRLTPAVNKILAEAGIDQSIVGKK